jgi:FAD binding domain in molybdopterin dehydrogenase
MKSFAYLSAADVDTALRSITSEPGAKFLAGGTNLVDLMREGIERPETVISGSVAGDPAWRLRGRQGLPLARGKRAPRSSLWRFARAAQ